MICKDPLEVISFTRLEMVRRGIKISDIASKLEVSNQSISQTLKISNPRLSTLYQICDALDLDISISPRDTE